MENNLIKQLLKDFESIMHTTDNWVEFWLAREIQSLLWYSKRDNFLDVINKAKESCKNSWNAYSDHFADVGKTIDMPKWAQKIIDDLMLTRYACYLIAQNWDSRKAEIAFAQTYFAVQTRKFEIIQQKLSLHERIVARKKLSETETQLSKVIFEQTKSDKNFALIRSKWDTALFARTTKDMKIRRGIKESQPLADFMPTILLKAKDFATEITIYNAKENKMTSEDQISQEHITNNASVRDTLISRGIVPENIKPEQDIKKVQRKIASEDKKLFKETKKLK
jgi:DNA-damage-inducible protein D